MTMLEEKLAVDSEPTPTYRIQDIPGKGLGILAMRNIVAGELVLREKPIMTMSFDDEDAGRHAELVQELSDGDKRRFFSLCDKDNAKHKSPIGIWTVSRQLYIAMNEY